MQRFYLYKVLPDGSRFVLDSGQTLDQLRPKIDNLGTIPMVRYTSSTI